MMSVSAAIKSSSVVATSIIGHAQRQIDQIRRRVILDEKIAHEEKVFKKRFECQAVGLYHISF